MDEVIDKPISLQKKKALKAREYRSEFDVAWKSVLDRFFQDFIELCLPQFYEKIDWSKDYESLDTELAAMARDVPIGKRIADKLFKVYFRDGCEGCFMLHAEIQGKRDKDMEERMYIYNFRIFNRVRRPVVSVAILIDGNQSWRPSQFRYGIADFYNEFKFISIKLLDFRDKVDILQKSSNRFAPIILAQLAILDKNPTHQGRCLMKIALTKALYREGWSKNEILVHYEFLDWLIALPAELELKYHEEIRKWEEGSKVAYITTAERIGLAKGEMIGVAKGEVIGVAKGEIIGLAKGEAKGEAKGKRQIVQTMFAKGLDIALIVELTGLSEEEIQKLKG